MPARDQAKAAPAVYGRLTRLVSSTAAANATEVCTPTPGLLISAGQVGEATLIASNGRSKVAYASDQRVKVAADRTGLVGEMRLSVFGDDPLHHSPHRIRRGVDLTQEPYLA